MGQPLPEDGSPLPFWKARRFIRNLVWLVGGLLIAYLLLLNLQKSRELEKTVAEKESAAIEQVADLSQLLQLVERAEKVAEEAGRRPAITTEQAIEALKKTFPEAVVERAIEQAARKEPPLPPSTTTTLAPTTTTTRRPVTTTTATTTTTRAPAPTTTTTSRPRPTTTTTTCLLDLLGIAKVGCR